MKRLYISLITIVISFSAVAQKKELKSLRKAIDKGDFTTAKTLVSSLESMLGAMDDKQKANFYLNKAKALFADGQANAVDMETAFEAFLKVDSKQVTGYQAAKDFVYNTLLSASNTLYQNSNFKQASKGFEQIYRLANDATFLYYAASSATSGKDYTTALKHYEKLKDLKYTGVETQYFAVNKETGAEEPFPTKALRDFSIKAGSHLKPTEKQTESKYAEIVKNIALIHIENGDNEKGLAAIKEARTSNPEDLNLILSEANVHFKMGNNDKFSELLKLAVKKDPTNPELQYNLGVMAADSGNIKEAQEYYEKAIELNPNYENAYINLGGLIVGKVQPLVDEMNALGMSDADNKRFEELQAQSNKIYKSAIVYFKKALEINPKSIMAASNLKSIYGTLADDANFKLMKEKLDQMQSGN